MEDQEEGIRPRGTGRGFWADRHTCVKVLGQGGTWKRKGPGKAVELRWGAWGLGRGWLALGLLITYSPLSCSPNMHGLLQKLPTCPDHTWTVTKANF